MSKGLICALVILMLSVIVLLFNKGHVEVNLLLDTINPLKSMAFLSFMAVGVVVGVLLK